MLSNEAISPRNDPLTIRTFLPKRIKSKVSETACIQSIKMNVQTGYIIKFNY